MYTQKEMLALMLPVLKSNGKVYRKVKQVLARKALEGEVIHTITSDGLETVNVSNEGDYIIKNQTQAGEMYIIKAEKFQDRYDFDKQDENGFSLYNAKGKVIAIEMTEDILKELGFDKEFYFMASWNESMIVKENDFLVCQPDESSIYRIARQEFFETYELDTPLI